MKSLKVLALSGITGVVMAGSVTATVFAWHPQVKITKYVTNVTAAGQMADANDAASAVATKPGDELKYTLVIENPASPSSDGHNDLYFTEVTDTLPAGVALKNDASKREITEDLGILKPGQKVTKEYVLKVTSTKDGDVISNEACVTGNSKVNDAPRQDCDVAVIKLSVPPVVSESPKTPPQVLSTSTTLPATGPTNIVVGAGVATALGYLGNLLRLKRRANKR